MEAILIAILLFLALGGLVGGIAMISKPDGSLLKLPTDLLKNSPVDTYLLPGIFLLVVMAVWPLVNIVAIVWTLEWGKASVITLGFVAMGWIIYQIVTIKTFWFLQPAIFIVGALLAILGYITL